MKLNKIEIMDVYDFKELMSMIPCFAETIYSVSVNILGYVHDVHIEVVLIPSVSNPTGWDVLKETFEECVGHCVEMWNTAAQYGYH